jgi:protein-S-isoprenylcysteine O-methyltransferase Ste14
VSALLAGAAGAFFLAAIVGLFWEAVPTSWWSAFVIVGAAASLLLHALFFGALLIIPLLVDVILLGGVLTKSWSADVLRMRTLQQAAARINPLLRIPVPWVYVLVFLAGLGLQYLAPITVRSAIALRMGLVGGVVFAIVGVLLAFSSLGLFRAAHTTTVPFETASKLVTWGPYQFTRNPMYVGLLLLYIGGAGIEGEPWPLILLLPLVLYLDRVVIPVEETRLREAFGDAYQQYCAKVRRWL